MLIPGNSELIKKKHFKKGLTCMVVGCVRRARHQWAYPCAITTMTDDPAAPLWLAVCDDCDVRLNRTLLREVGMPDEIVENLLSAYRQIQADVAFDHPSEKE